MNSVGDPNKDPSGWGCIVMPIIALTLDGIFIGGVWWLTGYMNPIIVIIITAIVAGICYAIAYEVFGWPPPGGGRGGNPRDN